MTDLMTPTQDAFYDALNKPAVTNLAPVFQHVPDEAQPPMIVIGQMSAQPYADTKDGSMDEITVEVITLNREPDRSALFKIMAANRAALEGQDLSTDEIELSPIKFLSMDDDLAEDGQTYIGSQRFSTIAQPA